MLNRYKMQKGIPGKSLALKPMNLKSTRGEVVEVGGGRILRSTGRKDRHSKVCTTRGPRDRRVRLSPKTAIQFYDVQDRLGFDRPSEAIDWLMKKAKACIEALDSCPPTTTQPEQDLEEQRRQDLSFFVPPASSDFQSFVHDPDFRSRGQVHGFCFPGEHGFFSSSPVHFDARTTNCSVSGYGEGKEDFAVNLAPPQWQHTVFWEQNQLFSSQGGTLQSSYPFSIPASVNDLNCDQLPPIATSSGAVDTFASPRIRGEGDKLNPVPNKFY